MVGRKQCLGQIRLSDGTHPGGAGGSGSPGQPLSPSDYVTLPRGLPSVSLSVFICNSGIIIAPASHGRCGD